MSTHETGRRFALVDDYLRRLDAAAQWLPADRRAELVLEIRDHIDEALAALPQPVDETGTRMVLERLGPPEEIVAAAAEGLPAPPPAPLHARTVERRPGTGLELAAVLLLTVGSLVPVVGWLAGVVCLWASRRWHTWEKLLGTLVVPGGPFVVLLIAGLMPTQTCFSSSVSNAAGSPTTTTTCSGFAFAPWAGVPLLLFVLVAPIVVAGWLYSRARARAALEPPVVVAVPYGQPVSRWGGLEIAAVVLLAAGAFVLPLIGPIVGLVLAWASNAWTTREKWVATALAGAGLLLGVVLFAVIMASPWPG